jgi:hypothetical protein
MPHLFLVQSLFAAAAYAQSAYAQKVAFLLATTSTTTNLENIQDEGQLWMSAASAALASEQGQHQQPWTNLTEVLTAGAWTCRPVFKMNFSFNNASAPFQIGDCMIPWNFTLFKVLFQGQYADTSFKLMVPAGTEFPTNTLGTFVPDAKCGCGVEVNYTCGGVRLTSVEKISSRGRAASISPIKCPEGQVAVQKVNTHPDNMCTQKYAEAAHPQWEKKGELCYPSCRDHFYGVGPVCWRRCEAEMKDIGVACSKNTYTPHTRAVWPWAHCHKDEKKYGVECISPCRSGYKWYNALALYYCGQRCPSGFTDAGLTCTKHTYGRGAGKLAVSPGKFVSIIAESIVGAAAVVASAVLTYGAATGGVAALFDCAIFGSVEAGGAAAGAASGAAVASEVGASSLGWVPALSTIDENAVAGWVQAGAIRDALIDAGLLAA